MLLPPSEQQISFFSSSHMREVVLFLIRLGGCTQRRNQSPVMSISMKKLAVSAAVCPSEVVVVPLYVFLSHA